MKSSPKSFGMRALSGALPLAAVLLVVVAGSRPVSEADGWAAESLSIDDRQGVSKQPVSPRDTTTGAEASCSDGGHLLSEAGAPQLGAGKDDLPRCKGELGTHSYPATHLVHMRLLHEVRLVLLMKRRIPVRASI